MRASCGYREADVYQRFTEVVGPVLAQASADAVRRQAADALARFLPYDALDLRSADDEKRELVPVLARGPRAAVVMRTGHNYYGHGLSGWVASHREALLTNDAIADPRAVTVLGTPRIAEAVIGIPLVANGRLKDVLLVRRFGEIASFSQGELSLTRCFADLMAIALGNAEARAELQRQANTDPLTGLANRRCFMEQLTDATTRAAKHLDQKLSVLLIDVDGLKLTNDTLGHHIGDRLLVTIAETLALKMGEDGLAARLAGDEFAALLPHANAFQASVIAHQLEVAINTAALETIGLRGAGVSVGWAEFETDVPAEELLQRADRSMYATKRRHHGPTVSTPPEES